MPGETSARIRFWSNRWLLLTNVVVLITNAVWFFLLLLDSSARLDPFSSKAHREAAALGMDLLCAKKPLAVLISKHFPQTNSFQLFDASQQLLMTSEDVDNDFEVGGATRSAMIVLGADFNISSYYSSQDGIRVHELQLALKEETLFDMNADGSFDMRIAVDGGAPFRTRLWYNGGWQEASIEGKWTKHERKLHDGTLVYFDRDSGRWLPRSDEPDAQSEPGP